MLEDYKSKKILIRTYPHESGLFYLAQSLGRVLSQNNEVYYIPKFKYKKIGRRFEPYIPDFSDNGITFEPLDVRRPVAKQIVKICRK